MSDRPTNPDPRHGTDAPPRAPGWVKAFAVGVLIVALLVIVAMLLMGGEHGPGRHGG
jgi:hypothetical protein